MHSRDSVRIDGPHFVGAAGCSSSSCHGGAGEKRSQYITWLRQDVHLRGYATLTNARSDAWPMRSSCRNERTASHARPMRAAQSATRLSRPWHRRNARRR